MAPLPAVLRTHSLVTWSIVHRRPTAIPRPIVWGLIGHCASPVSPVAPQPFCDVWMHHRPLCWLIDGSRHWSGTASGASQRSPTPPLRAHTDDPASITSGKGTYSGEIESLECQRAKLWMRSEPATNWSRKFDNRLYVFKTSYRFKNRLTGLPVSHLTSLITLTINVLHIVLHICVYLFNGFPDFIALLPMEH